MEPQPPIVDIDGLVDGDRHALERVAKEIEEPCRDWGAFQIVGHGLAESRLDTLSDAIRRFFALPDELKNTVRRSRDNARGYYDDELTKNRPDWKEVFDYGAERPGAPAPGDAGVDHSDGVNQWPEGAPELRRRLLEHFEDCERLGLALLRALCVSLGSAASTLDAAFADHSSFVRLNRYPPCPDPAPADSAFFPEKGHLGVHHHTDAGALTIVHQDEVGGLQILRDGRFVTVAPVRGALVVHLADMLQVWSNDRFRSPMHRVLTHRERERLSAPFFLNPSYSTVCEPLPALVAGDTRPHYRPVSWAHFRDQRSAGDYADYGAEIQIEQFRID
ncbi:MAG: isopenicillin N synthase family dioxygenase [Myxococcota bacterium]